MPYRLLILGLVLCSRFAAAETLTAERLGVVYNSSDAASTRVARYYAARRHIPPANLIGVAISGQAVINREELKELRAHIDAQLPSEVQSLLLVWTRPYAVECMSITMAVAAGYQTGFCEPGCGPTTHNPLFDSSGWLPADTAGWLPAMLLPSEDEALARTVIDRGIEADGSRPPGTVYLVRTDDPARNVRAQSYAAVADLIASRVSVRDLGSPAQLPIRDIIGYFTGAASVKELPQLSFRAGAAADHLTSTGGVLEGGGQMPILDWLRQGATASYGSVSEPCNLLGKFPNPGVLFDHYLRGDTLLEAYWKSVLMPGQGLFIGEPLARPFSRP